MKKNKLGHVYSKSYKGNSDPVKEYQKQSVDQRVCLFYVADRLRSIAEAKNGRLMAADVQEFIDECVQNIGMNALIERYEY